MARHTEKTVEEIVADPEAAAEHDEAVEEAIPSKEVVYRELDALPEDYPFETVSSFEDAKKEANIPPHVRVKDLVDIDIVIASWTPSKAALPETGELRDGFFCAGRNMNTRAAFTVWIGQINLVRDLTRFEKAGVSRFRTTIRKRGRSYIFS